MPHIKNRLKGASSRLLALTLVICMLGDMTLAFAAMTDCTCDLSISPTSPVNVEIHERGTDVSIHDEITEALGINTSSDGCTVHTGGEYTAELSFTIVPQDEIGGNVTLSDTDEFLINMNEDATSYTGNINVIVGYGEKTVNTGNTPIQVVATYVELDPTVCACEIEMVPSSPLTLSIAEKNSDISIEDRVMTALNIQYSSDNCGMHTVDNPATLSIDITASAETGGSILKSDSTGEICINITDDAYTGTIAAVATYGEQTTNGTLDVQANYVEETVCECELTLTTVDKLEIELDESQSGVSMLVNEQSMGRGFTVEYNNDNCQLHTDDSITPTYLFSVVDENWTPGDIVSGGSVVNTVTPPCEATIAMTVTYNDKTASDVFDLAITIIENTCICLLELSTTDVETTITDVTEASGVLTNYYSVNYANTDCPIHITVDPDNTTDLGDAVESDAEPTMSYSVKSESGGESLILGDDITIANITSKYMAVIEVTAEYNDLQITDEINVSITREFSDPTTLLTIQLPSTGEPESDAQIRVVIGYTYDQTTGFGFGQETKTYTGEVVSKVFTYDEITQALSENKQLTFQEIGYEFPNFVFNTGYTYEIYYTFEGVEGLISDEDVELPDEGATFVLDEFPTCTCEVVINVKTNPYEADLGTEVSTEIDINTLAEAAVEFCPFHSELSEDIDLEYTIENEVGGEYDITDTILSILMSDLDFTADLKINASYKDSTAEATIPVSLTRETAAPSIKINSYNGKTGELSITVNPNGNYNASIYMEDTHIEDITFRTEGGHFKRPMPYDMVLNVADTTIPKAVTNIKLERDPDDPTQVVITWDDGGDNDQKIKLKAENNGLEYTTEANIKSDFTLETVILNNMGDTTAPSTELQTQSDSNKIVVDIDNIPYNSQLEFITYDEALNGPVSVMYNIPKEVIYNTVVVDDYVTGEELTSITILAKENDTHDEAFETPLISSVEILDGAAGEVLIIDASRVTALQEDVSGLVLLYKAYKLSGTENETVRIKYTYTQVRDDIPAASGIITVTLTPVNSAPEAVDDGTAITSTLNAISGTTITIPWAMLLANDSDRETPDPTTLEIAEVRNVTSGTIDNIQSLKQIVITPSKTFYGVLKFEYCIYDGSLISPTWATVTINVEKSPNPPDANPVETYMQLTDYTKSIGLNVNNTGGAEYDLTISQNILVNGKTATSANGITLTKGYVEDESGGRVPYITLTRSYSSNLKADDVISFQYTVFNAYGTDTDVVSVTMTEGDDPLDMEGYLYVHRRPIAAFAPTITMNASKTYIVSATINSTNERSFDLDHQLMHASGKASQSEGGTRPDYSWNGIRAWEWGIKTVTGDWQTAVFDVDGVPAASTDEADIGSLTQYGTAEAARAAGLNWIQQKTTALISSTQYSGSKESIIISLRVRDIDADNTIGVWSDQRTVLLSSMKMKPVALFTLNSSTYEVSALDTEDTLDLTVDDLSYDPNGDKLINYEWQLTTGTGKTLINKTSGLVSEYQIAEMIKTELVTLYQNTSYNPDSSEYTLSLIVTDETGEISDKYSVTFNVFRGNEAPKFSDTGSILNDLETATVYQVDDGADGVVGDDWGTLTNNNGHPGKVAFDKMFTLQDDQSTGLIRLSWLLEGNNVQTRREWSDNRKVIFTWYKSDLSYNPFEFPFTNTVTDQGFLPGAYKISVSAKDSPQGEAYADGAAKTSYWNTEGYEPLAPPWHLYVVPKLDIFAEVQYNGWVLSGYWSGDVWVDKSYRISDGATLAEAGMSLEDIVPTIGDTIDLVITTSQYVTDLFGYEDYNNNKNFDGGETKINILRTSVNTDGTISWFGEYTIEDVDDAPEGQEFTTLRLMLQGSTTWGSETGEVMRTKQIPLPTLVLPVKLYDFRVTSISDPNISNQFLKYVNELITIGDMLNNGDPTDGALVGRLAVDKNSTSTDVTLDPIRKGYSYYFSVNSKGLNKDSDQVRIYPKLYAMTIDDSGNIIGDELIGCVPNKYGKYEAYTTSDISDEIAETYGLFYEGNRLNSLNNHAELRIPVSLRTTEGSEQTWYGRYGVPADARFFFADEFDSEGPKSDIEWKGQVLVAFETVAYKDGKARYNYVERKQWEKERALIPDALKTDYATQEAAWLGSQLYLGAVAVYDGNKSLRDDYTSNPVWNE